MEIDFNEARTIYKLLVEKASNGGYTAKNLLALLEEHFPGDVERQMTLLYFIYKIRWAMASNDPGLVNELIGEAKKYGVYKSLQTILNSISSYEGVL